MTNRKVCGIIKTVKGNAQRHDFFDSHSIPTHGSARMKNVKELIKKLKKVFTNPLTNPPKCGIINTSKGRTPYKPERN